MATLKFKDHSPYAEIKKRAHHSSDWKYTKYLEGLASLSLHDEHDRDKGKVVTMALFGLGRAGTIHLASILTIKRIIVKYIIEEDATKCEALAKNLNLSAQFLQPSEAAVAFADSDVDAVIVATPTSSHEEYISRGLKSGKAVFAEKPIAETTEAVARVYDLASEVGRPLFCAFNRRFDPSFSDVQKKVRSGELGHVQQIKLTSRDSPLPSADYLKISGGIFHDCMVHDIDLMTHILGELPVEVSTMATTLIPEIAEMDDYDNVVSMFKFTSGTIGVVDISRFASYGYDQRLEVFGPKGMLQVENDMPGRSVLSTSGGVSRDPIYWSFPSRHAQGYRNEMDHFLDIVTGKASLSVSGRMTMAVTKIAEAAEASARSGGHPVPLAWAPDEVPDGYVMAT